MTTDGRGSRSWLKYGCFGCVSLVVVALVVVGTATGIAILQVRSEEVETRTLDRAVPPPPGAGSGTPADVDRSPTDDVDALHVVLDVSDAELSIEPGPPGEPIHVEADYDTKLFELGESYDEAGRTYRVTFEKTGGHGLGLLRDLFGGHHAEVRVSLPAGAALSLDGTMRRGPMQAELGGLEISSLDLHLQQGAMQVGFRQPLSAPMKRFHVDGSQGAVILTRLGNASPGEVEVDHRMGALQLDLRGAWVRDANIDVTTNMCGGSLQLPRDVIVEGLSTGNAGIGSLEPPEIAPPTLRFHVASTMGELQVID